LTSTSTTTSTTSTTRQPGDELETEIKDRMSLVERMEYYGVPGVSIAVINNNVIEWARGYGVTEVGTLENVTNETLFQAASISKPVTAMAALYFVEEGDLDLDEDINNNLQSWKVLENEFTTENKVTLRRVLSHNAGLTVSGFSGYTVDEEIPTLIQILDGVYPANSPPIRVFATPGSISKYSGGGYVVMQRLLEDIQNQSFSEIMQNKVLIKLDMDHSTYEQPLPSELTFGAATGHSSNGEAVFGKWHTYPEMAAAGLWTTPSDLSRFAIEIQQSASNESNIVLSAEMTNEMLKMQFNKRSLGLVVGVDNGSAWFMHSGSNQGFICYMFAFVDTGQGAVVMTNSDNADDISMEIFQRIAEIYNWAYVPGAEFFT
jgi:CubicO group peptidase (beta-lactamase class C family)